MVIPKGYPQESLRRGYPQNHHCSGKYLQNKAQTKTLSSSLVRAEGNSENPTYPGYRATRTQASPRLMKKCHIMVDGKVRSDKTYPAGFMDIISIPKTDENYKLLPTTGGIYRARHSSEQARAIRAMPLLGHRRSRAVRNSDGSEDSWSFKALIL